jgi:1,4-dihydroxy-2-naphthoate octaprenyltransferase
MTAALQVVAMLLFIAALVAVVGGILYAFSWAMMKVVLFFPAIGKKHRHQRWDEITKRSGRQ